MNEYLSVKDTTETELEIKRSVFITRLIHAESEEEAQLILADIRKEHFKATHHCYAWIIGKDNPAKKFSDDGEPSGTAGKPILSALEYSSLTNVLCVVIRYFGGIKLGASGLTRAYSQAASECIRESVIVRSVRCVPLTVASDYSLYARLESYVLGEGFSEGEKIFSDEAVFTAYIPVDDTGRVMKDLTELSNGKARLTAGDEMFIDIPEE